jgi:thiamine biosynthesis lipoprotein
LRLVPPSSATAPHCLVVGLVILLTGVVSACSRRPEPAQFTGPTMGTTYHVTVSGADSPRERRAVQAAIDQVLVEIERHLSSYRVTSEIALLNRDESLSWQDVSPTLFAVLNEAQDVSELTGGSFDVTVAPLLDLWGHEPDSSGVLGRMTFQPPTPDQLKQAHKRVGYARLELRSVPRLSVRKSASGMRLTVDGIAPGYAVDRIATELRVLGHANFIVEIGGEVRAAGQRPEGGPWRIAIEAPLPTRREPLVGLRLRDAAVSTSGDYRDVRIDADGHRYSHTIDPRTGRTTSSALTSVTVIDANAIRADAYATALMVMGTEAGLAWAQAHRVPALFVERTLQPGEWRVVASPAFAEWRD